MLCGTLFLTLLSVGFFDFYLKIYFNPNLILQGEWWRLITFIFQPYTGSAIFLIFSLLFYYWLGTSLEREMGQLKFMIFYFSGMLGMLIFILGGAAIYRAVTGEYIALNSTVLDAASNVNLSMFLVFAAFNPDYQIHIRFLFPIKIKWLAIIDLIFISFSLVANPITFLNLVPLIALLNIFIFFRRDMIHLAKKIFPSRKRAVDFKTAARTKKEAKGFTHQCVICGVTDVSSPDMEFRYCSLCNGYQCYCSQHIFEHEHTKG